MHVPFWFLIEGKRRYCTGIRRELGGGGIGPWEWRGWRDGREFQHLFPCPHQGIDCAKVEEGCQDETLKRSALHGLWNSARELCHLGSGDDQMRQRAGQRGVFHPQLSDPSIAPLCQHWHWAAKTSQGCQIVTSKGGCEKPRTISRAGGTDEVKEHTDTHWIYVWEHSEGRLVTKRHKLAVTLKLTLFAPTGSWELRHSQMNQISK